MNAVPQRSGAALRQAAYRERVKEREHNALRNVDNGVTGKEGFDKEIPHTPLEITSKKKITTTRAREAFPFPENFEPDAKTWAVARECGLSDAEVWSEIQSMQDWARNAKGRDGERKDWQAFARIWFKRNKVKHGQKPQVQRSSRADFFAQLKGRISEAQASLDAAGDGGGSGYPPALPGLREDAA